MSKMTPYAQYCKTVNFCDHYKNAKINMLSIITHTFRKVQILIAMKFQTVENAKFYSSEN